MMVMLLMILSAKAEGDFTPLLDGIFTSKNFFYLNTFFKYKFLSKYFFKTFYNILKFSNYSFKTYNILYNFLII